MGLRTNSSDEILPSVSVIIPAFNNEKTIGQTLEGLKNIDYPADKIEIIVVNDASTDRTAEVAARYQCQVVQRQKRGGCAAAKNTGVEYAKNEIIAFIDADVMVTKNWLKELVAPFKDSAVGATGGRLKNKLRMNNTLERFIELDHFYRTRKEDTVSAPGSNSAYRREVLEVVGKLDPYIGEDPDLPYRVHSHGYRIVYTEKAVVYHPYPNDIWTYFKKHVYYGWQRVMIFLLRPQCRALVVKDEHTPLDILSQPFVLAAMFLSLPLIAVFDQSKYISLFLISLLILLNMPFLYYVYKREAKMLVFAFAISTIRTCAYVIGMVKAIFSFVKVKIIPLK